MGRGKKPAATDRVKVHYHGTLIDGTVFDSSVERGEPTSFGLNQVIAGWTEGLQLMPVGSKFRFYIPQELGYGSRNAGSIPPYSTLIFEVELLGIEK
jgi:FKBP-type peptidyl-prolyl cis-trans isomerase FklB